MKGISILKSKLTMPQFPDSIVISERINKLIKAIHKKNAVIITAPSGYGKTTLMIASLNLLKEKNCNICWYRMEHDDRNLAVFYAYLFEALFPNDDPQWEETRRTLDNFADHQSQYRYLNAIICQELWAYCNKHPDTKTFIAFEDFQHAHVSQEISESLAYLICNLPDNCTVLLSSRENVDILTEKQKLEKNILEINQNSLCFLDKEITTLLTKTYQINANEKLIQQILNCTEGWIAGIIMICRILSDSVAVEEDCLLAKPWQKTKLFNYITSEVLKTVDADMLQFLIKTATLHDFMIEEAEQIFEIANVAHLVSQCEKKGMFIQKIIRNNITYRFHGLFRDALLQLQHEYMTVQDIKNLNLKVAAYYLEHRVFGRAIEHFILCDDLNSAVELITRESVSLMTFESIEQLRLWLNPLPEEVIEQNPNLLYIKSFTYQQAKGNQMIPLMEKALVKFKEIGDLIMQIYSLIALIHYYMFTNNIKKLLDAISQALTILKLSNDAKLDYMTDVLLFVRAVYEEKFSKAMILSQRLRQCPLDEDWKWMVLAHSCMLGYLTGALDYAEIAINEGFESLLAKRGEFFNALALTYYCTVLFLKNDTATLSSVESHLTPIGEKYEYNFMLGFCKRASAYRKYALHDLESAVELLEASNRHFEEYGNSIITAPNKLCSLLWLSQGKISEKLLPEATRVLLSLSSKRSGFCHLEICQSIFGAIARECGEYKLAEEYLLTSVKTSEKKGARQILCGSYLHLAKLYFDTEETEKAEDYLQKAFFLASNGRYSMFWDIHLPTLTEMSIRCMKSGIYAEYAQELIKRYFKDEVVKYIARNISLLDDSSIRGFSEMTLLKYGVTSVTNFSCTIDIHLFGRFEIAVNGTYIPENEWKTKKIKGLLEYLVQHIGKAVMRDQLMDFFWPKSEKKSASVSLRAALYELKKVLAKYGIKNDSDTPFIHERIGSLEIKPNNMLSIDTDEFLSLYDEYKSNRKKGIGEKRLLPILERMNTIYSGDLLAEEIYSDWTFVNREAYKSIFQETVTALASLYIEVQESNMAEKLLLKVLSIDPYNEEACLMLLRLYISLNQRSRAAKLYSDFEKRLIKDLDIRPDVRLLHTAGISSPCAPCMPIN